jgi:hypothetical protein
MRMKEPYSIQVECRGPRPEAGAISIVAWGRPTEVHLAGDFEGPTDESWTRLSVVRVDNAEQRIDIEPVSREPLVLRVSSSEKKCADNVAFFIAMESHGRCF